MSTNIAAIEDRIYPATVILDHGKYIKACSIEDLFFNNECDVRISIGGKITMDQRTKKKNKNKKQ